MRKIYDVTLPVYEGMPVYKNKPEKQPKLETVTNGHVTESRISMDLHTGTHIDAPLHMINDGDTFQTISLEDLVRNVKVLDLTNVEDGITKADLMKFDITKDDFLLFKTKNSYDEAFNYDFIFLKADGASYLAEKGIRGVGIDALGVERSQPEHPTHKTLFGAGIIVIEGLALKDIAEGKYFMVASPLKLLETDAAPARIILIEE